MVENVEKKWFAFVSNGNILRNHFRKDGIDIVANPFAENVVDFISHFILSNLHQRMVSILFQMAIFCEIIYCAKLASIYMIHGNIFSQKV